MAEITERDREIARAFRASGFAGWMDGVSTEQHLIEKLAQALANHAAEARREENEACYRLAYCAQAGALGNTNRAIGLVANAIAARRGGHG
jgi:hypothetical protein